MTDPGFPEHLLRPHSLRALQPRFIVSSICPLSTQRDTGLQRDHAIPAPPNYPFRNPKIPSNRDHKALNGGTVGGRGTCPKKSYVPAAALLPQRPRSGFPSSFPRLSMVRWIIFSERLSKALVASSSPREGSGRRRVALKGGPR